MNEYVFSMYRADKFYGPGRQVLANISLSFFHGAKIGVLGPNGAGKSTLLRIAAGVLAMDGGERTLGHNVDLAFYAQHQLESLDARRSALEGPMPDSMSSAGLLNAPPARMTSRSAATCTVPPPALTYSMPVARVPCVTTRVTCAPVSTARLRRTFTGLR